MPTYESEREREPHNDRESDLIPSLREEDISFVSALVVDRELARRAAVPLLAHWRVDEFVAPRAPSGLVEPHMLESVAMVGVQACLSICIPPMVQ